MSSGLPAVRATCAELGLDFDPWQIDLARCILSKDSAGLYAADTAVLSIPRQVGKTFLVGALVFADCIINPGSTIVWTAHRFAVARESFNEMKAWAQRSQLAPHIDADEITTAAGNECIPFRNGSRILFKARERGAIRGFTKVRRLILDEAQILTETAMSDLAPTMNQATNPQMILMGTPPKPNDPSEVFTNLRDDALNAAAEGVFYVEFSADERADLDDQAAWAEANPSLGKRTSVKAIQRLRKLLSDDDFAREALGIWARSHRNALLDIDAWVALGDDSSSPAGDVAFAVDIPPERRSASIAVAGLNADGIMHVELTEKEARSGTAWVAERLVELIGKWDGPVALDPGSPAGSLIPDLVKAGIEPVLVNARELAQACGLFYDKFVAGDLRHLNQPLLNTAVDAARKRTVGEAWAWHRRDTSTDISPLVAATLAAHLASKAPKSKKRSGRAAFF